MKNFFNKNNHTALWIGAGITGALAAGAGILYYLRGRRPAESKTDGNEHAQDYLDAKHPKKKKQKTDTQELVHLIHHE